MCVVGVGLAKPPPEPYLVSVESFRLAKNGVGLANFMACLAKTVRSLANPPPGPSPAQEPFPS